LAGLAGGVVSRVGAERALSWRAMFDRAVEDWHWFLVGFGSVTAAFFSVTFVSAVLHFGPAPERQDSVAALLSSRDWQVRNAPQGGSLYVWVNPIRDYEWRIALTGRDRQDATTAEHVPDEVAELLTEEDLVGALGDALTGTGQPIDAKAMTPAMRTLTAALFTKLMQLQRRQLLAPVVADSAVYRLQFVTNTEVTAKGL
jgi:hypothetical protein